MNNKIIHNIRLSMSVAVICVSLLLTGCYFPPKDEEQTNIITQKEYHEPIRVGTYNIQYDNTSDSQNPWSSRKVILQNILDDMNLDIFGSQEPYKSQIADMMTYLEDSYAWVGTDINGQTTRDRVHYNPIFYKKDRFKVMEQGIFWFSETPDVPSKFSDSYSVRMCNWVLFQDMETEVEFYHFNCHFDHVGATAKAESGKLLPKKVAEIAGDKPAFVTGDFNSNQRTTAYNNIVASGTIVDSFTKTENRENDTWHTHNDYKYTTTPNANATRIDHVFVTPNKAKVMSWKIVNNSYNQKYPSDHFPVVIEWAFEKTIGDEGSDEE